VLSSLIRNLAATGADLFAIHGKVPAFPGWQAGASCDPVVLEGQRQRFGAHCGFGWALTPGIVVSDSDESRNQRGLDDFKRLDGRDPRDIATPTATSPTGGLHNLWATGGRSFKNIRIKGTAIDIKTVGGFIVVPDVIDGIGNGREWLPGRAPWEMPLAPAPAWMDEALRRETIRSPAAVPAPDGPPSDEERGQARAMLKRACDRIREASCGERDTTRHRECFTVGGLVGRGDLDEAEAFEALLAAAREMQARGHGWHDLERRVAASLAAGIKRPLPLSEIDQWMRHWCARLKGQVHA
jgi:hypothetical protein